ncbi:hypothetical protein ncot_16320 [Nocardioides sp. JQ2195]|uniref:hypothetical protein n=1 Tax=Nocardioides sp. JQ2195 TaxID=2592334 RepID=UPI00143ED1A3|nr:hypothetical protein [Nocardioides sp. JQ2195]QIX27982.1 hypothetical protein ncot_16320 [Nocardioides sp. JQ2195]
MSDQEEQPTTEAEETTDSDTSASDDAAGTSPAPEPTSEEPQLFPGGVDSIDDPKYGDTPGDPVSRDLDPDNNPAISEDAVPDEITEPDDKQQEPDNGEADLDAGQTGESEEPA